MIPFDHLPGAKQWVSGLPLLVAHTGPIWVFGQHGSGVSTIAQWIARQRNSVVIEFNFLDGLLSWLNDNPRGVVASKQSIDSIGAKFYLDFLELRLWDMDEDPSALPNCLEYLASQEGIDPPFPPALFSLPCRGNLKELRNRLIRWQLLGQLPEPSLGNHNPQLLDTEDIASNLHILERTLLHRALKRSYGNRAEAAKRLGICRRQLYLLIKRHGDPLRGELPISSGLKRMAKIRHNLNSGGNQN